MASSSDYSSYEVGGMSIEVKKSGIGQSILFHTHTPKKKFFKVL